MRTEKQIEASRRNGARSKGPVTEIGKARASRNGTTHGLAGGHNILYANERDDLYAELLAGYIDMFQPANAVECDLVSQIVAAAWRMKRIESIEAAAVDRQMERQQAYVDDYKNVDDETRQAIAFSSEGVSGTVMLVGRYLARARRCYDSAYKILRELQRERRKSEGQRPPVPQPVSPQRAVPVLDASEQQPHTAPGRAPFCGLLLGSDEPQLPSEPKNQPEIEPQPAPTQIFLVPAVPAPEPGDSSDRMLR